MARAGWHKSASSEIKKVQPKKAASKKNGAKKAASKKTNVTKGNTVEIILEKMADMEQMGITEVMESILLVATGYSRPDSNGYRNAMKQLKKELNYLEKTTKDKKTTYTLTETGRNHLLEIGKLVIPEEPASNEEYHEQLLQNLEKIVKAPKEKLVAIFNTLKDGKWHSVADLLDVSGYGRTDSNGYRNIMTGLKKFNLLEKSGKNIRFSDEAFKLGRPNE